MLYSLERPADRLINRTFDTVRQTHQDGKLILCMDGGTIDHVTELCLNKRREVDIRLCASTPVRGDCASAGLAGPGAAIMYAGDRLAPSGNVSVRSFVVQPLLRHKGHLPTSYVPSSGKSGREQGTSIR